MAEYIEREAAIAMIRENGVCGSGWSDQEREDDVVDMIESIPAAAVRPVVRGTWIGIDDFPHDDWECDHCGCVVENTNDPWNYYHFCPNCGAMMEES